MRKRKKRICSVILSVAMAATCVMGTPMVSYGAAENDYEESSRNSEALSFKKNWVEVSDNFSGEGLDTEWNNTAGNVTWLEGKLHMENNGGTVSSIKRNVGNDNFTVETKWSDYSADTAGNNSVVIFRISDGTDNNMVEIQRFSNGELKLLVINNLKQTSFTTKKDFADDHGWFRLNYDNETQMITAEYKVEDQDNYIEMSGSGTVMTAFGGNHVAELRAQKWSGRNPVSVDYRQFNAKYAEKTFYKVSEMDDFDSDVLDGSWYGAKGTVTLEESAAVFKDSGSGISTIKRNIGNQAYSVEAQWSQFTSDQTGAAILRTSQDSSENNFAQIRRQGDGNIWFTVVDNGVPFETSIPYTEDHGWFRIDYDSDNGSVRAFYKTEEDEAYIELEGSGQRTEGLFGTHTVELLVDNWGIGTTIAAFNKIQMDYNLKQDLMLQSENMKIEINDETGGIYQLSDPSDGYGTNYVINPSIRPKFNIDDSRWVGDLKFTVSKDGAKGYPAMTSLSDDIRQVERNEDQIQVSYRGEAKNSAGIKDFELTESYQLNEDGKQLKWNINIKNTSNNELEIQDLGIPLLMNSWWSTDQEGIYEQNVARHSYVAKDGSYIYWQRPNGDGSFLVMIPQEGTSLEFKDKARYGEGPFAESDPSWEGLVEYYIHSKDISTKRPGAYLPSTSLTLQNGQDQDYGFTFCFAQNYTDLHDILFEAGIADTISLPGMVIPQDTKATLAVRAKDGIQAVVGEDGKNIAITEKGEGLNGYSLYEIEFTELGENFITVIYGEGKESVLQYYSTKPIEELIKTNTDFIVNNQQAKTDKGYNGAYLQWNMNQEKAISWDDYPGGGWKEWMAGGSDDAGLSPAVYLSEKNITMPEKEQIDSLDYYIENYIWGYLQKNDTYEIYRWYDGKNDTPHDQGTWRSYNYIHVANTYYNMYQIALDYPGMTKLDANTYLMRAYGTLKAMFTYGMFDGEKWGDGGQGAYVFGAMGEMNLPNIMNALEKEGYSEEFEYLKDRITVKMETLFAEEYPFASEMSIDTTGFESCYTLAKLFGNDAMAEKVMKASMACRGIQPLWYFNGSDNRHMGESWWNLGYETQLGAWQQQDYLLTYADVEDEEFSDMMRSTYSAYLAGWANINVGQISDSPANYGAAAWQYQSEKGTSGYNYIPNLDGWWSWSGESALGFWGGLKTASANVVNDEVVGLYGYGCEVEHTDGLYRILPNDGVRTKLTMYNQNKLTAEFKKAKYQSAEISDGLDRFSFILENVTEDKYSPEILLQNIPTGEYLVSVDGKLVNSITCDNSQMVVVVNDLNADIHEVTIEAKKAVELSGLEVSAPVKTVYEKGEELDLTGLNVLAIYSNGEKRELSNNEYEVKGFNKNLPGNQKIMVYYKEGTTYAEGSFSLTVKDSVIQQPSKTSLYGKIEEAKAIKIGNYTKASYNTLINAIAAAEKVVANPKASQIEIDAQITSLTKAIQGLQIDADKEAAAKVKLSWKKISDADGYIVKYRTSKGWKTLKTIKKNSITSYVYKKAALGKKYTFAVSAYKKADGDTVYSKYKTITIKAVPQNPLIKANMSKGNIRITWKKVSSVVSGYRIYKKTGKNWNRIGIVDRNTTSFRDKNVKKGKSYTYKIRAYKKSKGKTIYGKYSNVVKVK